MTEIPPYLYKYKTFDDKNHYKDMILFNALFFASQQKLNDPFDCNVLPNYNIGTDDEMLSHFLKYSKSDNPTISEQEQLAIAQKKFKANRDILRSPELFTKRALEIINKMFGICSLSANKNNLLMWAHYTNCHKGFCLEYNAQLLFKYFLDYLKTGGTPIIEKVRYSTSYPILNPYEKSYKEDIIKWIVTKSDDWGYEKEWRLINDRPNSTMIFQDGIISSIIFGVNCSKENIDLIKILIKDKEIKPKLFQAYLLNYNYGLEYKSILL